MSVVEELEQLFQSFQPKPDRAEELKRLSEFFEAMKAEGVASIREYDLPQLDTVGRSLHETKGGAA